MVSLVSGKNRSTSLAKDKNVEREWSEKKSKRKAAI